MPHAARFPHLARAVLLVDQRAQPLVVSELERLNFETVRIGTVSEAVASLRARRPQVVLLAARLAEGDLGLAKQLGAEARALSVPVLLLADEHTRASTELGATVSASAIVRHQQLATELAVALGVEPLGANEWVRTMALQVPMDSLLAVDFATLTTALPSLSEEVQALVRLFDGRRTVADVVRDSMLSETLTLEATTRLFLKGIINRVKPAVPELLRPKLAPSLFSRTEEAPLALVPNAPRVAPLVAPLTPAVSLQSPAANVDPIESGDLRLEVVLDTPAVERTDKRVASSPSNAVAASPFSAKLTTAASVEPSHAVASSPSSANVAGTVAQSASADARDERRVASPSSPNITAAVERDEQRTASSPSSPQLTASAAEVEAFAPSHTSVASSPSSPNRSGALAHAHDEARSAALSANPASLETIAPAHAVASSPSSANLAGTVAQSASVVGLETRDEKRTGSSPSSPQLTASAAKVEAFAPSHTSVASSPSSPNRSGALAHAHDEARSAAPSANPASLETIAPAHAVASSPSSGSLAGTVAQSASAVGVEARDEKTASSPSSPQLTASAAKVEAFAPSHTSASVDAHHEARGASSSSTAASLEIRDEQRTASSPSSPHITAASANLAGAVAQSASVDAHHEARGVSSTAASVEMRDERRIASSPSSLHITAAVASLEAIAPARTGASSLSPANLAGAVASVEIRDELRTASSPSSPQSASVDARDKNNRKNKQLGNDNPTIIDPFFAEEQRAPTGPEFRAAPSTSQTIVGRPARPEKPASAEPDLDNWLAATDPAAASAPEPSPQPAVASPRPSLVRSVLSSAEADAMQAHPADAQVLPEDLLIVRPRRGLFLAAALGVFVLALVVISKVLDGAPAPVTLPVAEHTEPADLLEPAEKTSEELAAALDALWPLWVAQPPDIATGEAAPADPGPLNEAAALYEAGRLRDARAAIERLLETAPSAAAWVLLGQVKFDAGDLAGARVATDQALALDSKFAHAYMLKATIALDVKDDASARAALEQAIALDPNGPDVAEAKALLQRTGTN